MTTALATTPKDVGALIKQQESQIIIKSLLPNLSEAEIARAMIYYQNYLAAHTDLLEKCSKDKLFIAFISALETGFVPGQHQNYIYLIPYAGVPNVRISYLGLIQLAFQANAIDRIKRDVIRKADKFDPNSFDETTGKIDHKYPPLDVPRGDIIGAYAIVRIPALNIWECEIIDREIIDKAKKASKKQAKGETTFAWEDWEDQMAKKVAIKRLLKIMQLPDPSSYNANKFQRAIAIDDESDTIEAEIIETETKEQEKPISKVEKLKKRFVETGKEQEEEGRIQDTGNREEEAKADISLEPEDEPEQELVRDGQTEEPHSTAPETEAEKTKGRGRPLGAKNKPKPEETPVVDRIQNTGNRIQENKTQPPAQTQPSKPITQQAPPPQVKPDAVTMQQFMTFAETNGIPQNIVNNIYKSEETYEKRMVHLEAWVAKNRGEVKQDDAAKELEGQINFF